MLINGDLFDLRVKKTYRALYDAFTVLLSTKKFVKITVIDICEKSVISRATFYGHFNDKYDLLQWWLKNWKPIIPPIRNDYIAFNQTINAFVINNKGIIQNLLNEATDETIELLVAFFSSLLFDFIGAENAEPTDQFKLMLYHFCAGGILNLFRWQTKKRTSSDLEMRNIPYYKVLDAIRQLESGYDGNKT